MGILERRREMNGKTIWAITSEAHRDRLAEMLPEIENIVVDPDPDVRAILSRASAMRVDVVVVDEDGVPHLDVSGPEVVAFPLTQTGQHKTRIVVVPAQGRQPGDRWLAELVSATIYDIVDTSSVGGNLAKELRSMIETPRTFQDSARFVDLDAATEQKKKRRKERGFGFFRQKKNLDDETPDAFEAAAEGTKEGVAEKSPGSQPSTRPQASIAAERFMPAAAAPTQPAPSPLMHRGNPVMPSASERPSGKKIDLLRGAPADSTPKHAPEPAAKAKPVEDADAGGRIDLLRDAPAPTAPEPTPDPAARTEPAGAGTAGKGSPQAHRRDGDATHASIPLNEVGLPDIPESVIAALTEEIALRIGAELESQLAAAVDHAIAAALPPADDAADVCARPRCRKAARRVAVAGLVRGAGCTHLALDAALWISKRFSGTRKVCCELSDAADLNAIKDIARAPKADSVVVSGVRFVLMGDDTGDAEYVVSDCGVVREGCSSPATSRFATADLRLMCVCGDVVRAVAVREAAAGMDPSFAKQSVWCFRGAGKDYAERVLSCASPEGGVEWRPLPPSDGGWWVGRPADYSDLLGGVIPPNRRERRAAGRKATAAERADSTC